MPVAKRILMIGGNGFIGSNFLDVLERLSVHVINCVRDAIFLDATNHSTRIDKAYFEMEEVERQQLLEDVDLVLYLAWSGSPQIEDSNILFGLERNVTPFGFFITDLSKCKKAPAFVFVSTGGLLYDPDAALPYHEASPLAPAGMYGINKAYCENLIKHCALSTGVSAVIVRPTNPYGPYQAHWETQGVVAKIFKAVLAAEPFEIWGDGLDLRDYIYVGDLADFLGALVRRLDNSWPYKNQCIELNVSCGAGTTVLELIRMVESITQQKIETRHVAASTISPKHVVVSAEKAKRLLDWEAKTSIGVGLQKTYDWYQKHGL